MPHAASGAARASTADFAVEYASFCAGLQAAALPHAAITAAKNTLFDTLAGAAAGAAPADVAGVADLVRGFGGAPQAAIWWGDAKVPAHEAAWVNAMMAECSDEEDAAVLHAGVAVIPAVLAAATLAPTATGADVLAAIVAGLELVCRLGVATSIGPADSGFLYTPLLGVFGAAAAGARVLRLDPAQTVQALGIALSQATGPHSATRDGAPARRLQAGFAARAGVLSAQLAQRDLTAGHEVFEGADGLFRIFLRGHYDPERLRQKLGARFFCTSLAHKPYPCSRLTHTAIDAARAMRDRAGFAGAKIRRIDVRVNRRTYEAVCAPADLRRAPRSVAQARFSLPYCVAVALLDGTVGLAHFTEKALRRTDVLTLAQRVDCRVDEVIDRASSPTRLRIETAAGALVERVDTASAPADFAARLAEALAFRGRSADTLVPLIEGIETLDQLRPLNETLHKS